MKKMRDQNGNAVIYDIKKEDGGWGVNVFYGGGWGPVTNTNRYIYRTRKDARNGDIGDNIGYRGRIA